MRIRLRSRNGCPGYLRLREYQDAHLIVVAARMALCAATIKCASTRADRGNPVLSGLCRSSLRNCPRNYRSAGSHAGPFGASCSGRLDRSATEQAERAGSSYQRVARERWSACRAGRNSQPPFSSPPPICGAAGTFARGRLLWRPDWRLCRQWCHGAAGMAQPARDET